MTIKQLKKVLSKYPDNMEILIGKREIEYPYNLENSVRSEEITFADGKGDVVEKNTVVIINEDCFLRW